MILLWTNNRHVLNVNFGHNLIDLKYNNESPDLALISIAEFFSIKKSKLRDEYLKIIPLALKSCKAEDVVLY